MSDVGFQCDACCLPPSVVVRIVLAGEGGFQSQWKGEGLEKAGPNIRARMFICGSLCVLSGAKGPLRRRGALWNYSYSLIPERKALDSRTQKTHPLRFAVTIWASLP